MGYVVVKSADVVPICIGAARSGPTDFEAVNGFHDLGVDDSDDGTRNGITRQHAQGKQQDSHLWPLHVLRQVGAGLT